MNQARIARYTPARSEPVVAARTRMVDQPGADPVAGMVASPFAALVKAQAAAAPVATGACQDSSELPAGAERQGCVGEVAALLRRVTMSYYGREQYASTTGSQWLEQLQTLAPGTGFSAAQLELLAHQRYRAHCEFDVEELLRSTETWLRALPRRRDNVSA